MAVQLRLRHIEGNKQGSPRRAAEIRFDCYRKLTENAYLAGTAPRGRFKILMCLFSYAFFAHYLGTMGHLLV